MFGARDVFLEGVCRLSEVTRVFFKLGVRFAVCLACGLNRLSGNTCFKQFAKSTGVFSDCEFELPSADDQAEIAVQVGIIFRNRRPKIIQKQIDLSPSPVIALFHLLTSAALHYFGFNQWALSNILLASGLFLYPVIHWVNDIIG